MEKPIKEKNLHKDIHWIITNQDAYAGEHLLAEFWGAKEINDPLEIEKIFKEAALLANTIPLEIAVHKFEPQGITAFVILEESHMSIHTWPEEKYMAIDVFTCGDRSKPHKALKYLEEIFKPNRVDIQNIKRGKRETTNEKVFGQELVIDLYDCNPEYIKSKEKILEYSDKLCELIEMKKFGEPFIERFAEHSEFAAGYSLAQMIETSLVSGHFSEAWNRAYINIFSCKTFDSNKAIEFSKAFFEAKNLKTKVDIR